jgi:hypothetical protein
VIHRSRKDVGYRLDASMRMPWKTGEVVLRVFVAEIIEQKERVELLGISKSKCAAKVHTGAFNRGLSFNYSLNWPD